MKALLIFLIPWLRCLRVTAFELLSTDVDAFDGSVLLHRDMQLHSPAVGRLPLSPSAAFSELAHRAVLRAGHHLQGFESKLEAERKEIEALRLYVEKVLNNFGKRDSIFGELRGLLPAGDLAEEDREMGVKFLALLRDEAFAKAMHAGVQEMGRALAAFSSRTEKRVSELVTASASSSEAELPQLINKFFGVQQHIASTLVEKMETGVQQVLFAVPEEYSFVATFAGSLIKQLVNATNERVAHDVELIAKTNGTRFCGELDLMLTDQVLPLANDTMHGVSLVETFAQSNIPDVVPVVQKMTKQVTGIAGSVLASLARDSRAWADQICSLIVAASPAS